MTVTVADLLRIKGIGKHRLIGLVDMLVSKGVIITDPGDCLGTCAQFSRDKLRHELRALKARIGGSEV